MGLDPLQVEEARRETLGQLRYIAGVSTDGVTDNTTLINTAIAAATVGTTLKLPAGNIYCAGQVTGKYGVSLKGDGIDATILLVPDTDVETILLSGSISRTSSFVAGGTGDITQGGRTVTLVAGEGASFAFGDEVVVRDTSVNPGVIAPYWRTRVADVTGDVLTFEDRAPAAYTIARSGTVARLTAQASCTISDLQIQVNVATATTTSRARAIHATYGQNVRVLRCRFVNFARNPALTGGPVWMGYMRGTVIRDCEFDYCLDPPATRATTSATQCIILDGCTSCSASRNVFRRSSSAIVASSAAFCTASGNLIGGASAFGGNAEADSDVGGRGIKFANGCWGCKANDNIIHEAAFTGILFLDSSFCVATGNLITGFRSEGIHLWIRSDLAGATGAYATVTGNTIRNGYGTSSKGIWSDYDDSVISNNTIARIGDTATQNSGRGILLNGRRNVVSNNRIDDCTYYGVHSLNSGGFYVPSNNTILANRLTNTLTNSSDATYSMRTDASSGNNLVIRNVCDHSVAIHTTDTTDPTVDPNLTWLAKHESADAAAYTIPPWLATVTSTPATGQAYGYADWIRRSGSYTKVRYYIQTTFANATDLRVAIYLDDGTLLAETANLGNPTGSVVYETALDATISQVVGTKIIFAVGAIGQTAGAFRGASVVSAPILNVGGNKARQITYAGGAMPTFASAGSPTINIPWIELIP